MPRTVLGVGVLAVVVMVGMAGRAPAQEVKWRHDYAAARKEAVAAGRPLLLDFGTESCFWCKKLDATTFRAPAVARLLNDRFVPVKVDAEKAAWLARAAQVESYPTLLLVAPDGRIIARQEGYMDTAKMTVFLSRAPVAPPASGPVAPVARTGSATAAELLGWAKADHDAGRYLACIERCERLVAAHPNTAEAAEARQLAAHVAADPEKWKQVTGQLAADLSALQRALDTALLAEPRP